MRFCPKAFPCLSFKAGREDRSLTATELVRNHSAPFLQHERRKNEWVKNTNGSAPQALLSLRRYCAPALRGVYATPVTDGEGTVPVYMTQEATAIDVTLDDLLWIEGEAGSNTATVETTSGGDLTVTNNLSSVGIKVTGIRAGHESNSAYDLVSYDNDFTAYPADSKKYALAYGGDDLLAGKELDDTIAANASRAYPLTGKMSASTETIAMADETLVGHVVMNIGLDVYVKSLSTMSISYDDTYDFYFEEGMTWGEWIDSEYSAGPLSFYLDREVPGAFSVEIEGIPYFVNALTYDNPGRDFVEPSDIIIADYEYVINEPQS